MADLRKLADSPPEFKRDVLRRMGGVAIFIIITALILFIAAGTIKWYYAWLYLAATVVSVIINAIFMPADLIAERGRKQENVEKWDPALSGLLVVPWLVSFLIAGLDIRWGWSPELSAGWHWGGLAFYLLGNFTILWAMTANHFFSTAVRIQFERGQTVCSSGPYRYVRHPGYVGMIVYNLATPIALGSIWALIPTLLTVALFVTRTGLEDKTLLKKLPGYEQYAARTEYRLIPGLW
ncbi:MAG: Isoprenylcysteine carboxyl methyltransferase [Firmicutes bacterium]|nr:Isoprenylcysteine carboxyl methyltransferase [Bacillota bacterium]